MRCRICGRQLRDRESVRRGVGPVCAAKVELAEQLGQMRLPGLDGPSEEQTDAEDDGDRVEGDVEGVERP